MQKQGTHAHDAHGVIPHSGRARTTATPNKTKKKTAAAPCCHRHSVPCTKHQLPSPCFPFSAAQKKEKSRHQVGERENLEQNTNLVMFFRLPHPQNKNTDNGEKNSLHFVAGCYMLSHTFHELSQRMTFEDI